MSLRSNACHAVGVIYFIFPRRNDMNVIVRHESTRKNAPVQITGSRWRMALAGTLALLAMSACAQAPERVGQAPIDIKGRWITESGNLEVEIAPCGDALCGTVVKVLANRAMGGDGAEMKPVDDRPALGMKILSEFKPQGDGEWRGSIYNRENGKTYRCVLAPLAADQLKVRGYVGLPLFGKTQVWHRVDATAKS
jgi:uncharacterized protein (DUF2147 family)